MLSAFMPTASTARLSNSGGAGCSSALPDTYRSSLRVVLFNKNFAVAVVQSLSHVRLCDLIDCSTPGFPILHHLLELDLTHVHQVSDAI